jgi:hypothetical protein
LLLKKGTGQRAIADSFSQGNITTNALLWFQSPAQIGFGFIPFLPEDPTEMINPDMVAVMHAAFLAGSDDGCVDFVTNTTDKLCKALFDNSLIPELGTFTRFF